MVHENFRWQTPIEAVSDVITSDRIGKPFFARVCSAPPTMFLGPTVSGRGRRFIIEDLGIHFSTLHAFSRRLITDHGENAAGQLGYPRRRCRDDAAGPCEWCRPLSWTAAMRRALQWSRSRKPSSRSTAATARPPRPRLSDDRNQPQGVEARDVAPNLLPWAARPWQNIQDSVLAIQSHWVECLDQRGKPGSSGHDNLNTFALVEAADRSAAVGQTIDLTNG